MMKKLSHIECEIEIHIVWTTKYRYKILTDKIAKRCRNLLIQICRNMEIDLLKGIIGKDYVYIVLSIPPELSVEKVVQILKEKTSKIILKEYKELKRKYREQHLWANGYFCQSVGNINSKEIKKYIENQDNEYEKIFKIVD